MAVTSYDGGFSFMQDAVARLGEDKARLYTQAPGGDRSLAEERKREVEEASLKKLSERDKKRAKTDTTFKPQDTDFSAPKSFNFNPGVNYYDALGVDEYCSLEDVKKAYKSLSLTYHPDKTTGLTKEEREEFAAIFIEVKNAYKLLADQPTRRQYDYLRDKETARCDLRNKPRPEDLPAFNARAFAQKLKEKHGKSPSRLQGDIVRVDIACKLEKFAGGGTKAFEQKRQMRVRSGQYISFEDDWRVYRVDIPPNTNPPFVKEFKHQGSQHDGRENDTLEVHITAKPHKVVEVVDGDLVLKEHITVNNAAMERMPHLIQFQANSVAGRAAIIWGANPFHLGRLRSGDGEALHGNVEVRILEEGLNGGAMKLSARVPLAQRAQSRRPGLERLLHQAPSEDRRLSDRRVADGRKGLSIALDLMPICGRVPLGTLPGSSIRFYQGSYPGGAQLFACCVHSPACAKKKMAQAWEKLQGTLVPVVRATSFLLLRDARACLPRPLAACAADRGPDGQVALSDAEEGARSRLQGNESYLRGHYWIALWHYSRARSMIPEDHSDVPKIVCNEAACFLKVGDLEGSLAAARRATVLAPQWVRSWERLGSAALACCLAHSAATAEGDNTSLWQEAVEALEQAINLQPSLKATEALQTALLASPLMERSEEAAHAAKEEANKALAHSEVGRAIALYTRAIALLPNSQDTSTTGFANPHSSSSSSLLRAVLFGNRSAAHSRATCWDAAVADAHEAVAAQPHMAKAHQQLGVAYLACRRYEKAYAAFAQAVLLQEFLQQEDVHSRAFKGRRACLAALQFGKSKKVEARRRARNMLDSLRPLGSTRIFGIADVYFQRKRSEDWVYSIDGSAFLDDVLIVAGNLADSLASLARALAVLKSKFRRVFYVTGSEEMRLHADGSKFPDSLAKFHSICDLCDEMEVDVAPAAICEGVYIVPLQSWFSAEFDDKDPFPSVADLADKAWRWPMDCSDQVWRYMLSTNQQHLSDSGHQTVLSFSHFVPRRNLPYKKAQARRVGCEAIDGQVRAVSSKLHFFGAGGAKCAQVSVGVRYAHLSLNVAAAGLQDDNDDLVQAPLMMLHNGRTVCMTEWGIDNSMQARLVRIEAVNLAGAQEIEDCRVKMQKMVQELRTVPGVTLSLTQVGSRKLRKPEFVNKIWPDMDKHCLGATHVLMIIADNLQILQTALRKDEYKRDWVMLLKAHAKDYMLMHCPLGLNLQPGASLPDGKDKEDPIVAIQCVALPSRLTQGSEEYGKMLAAVAAINSLPGAAGKIAASIQPMGLEPLDEKALQAKIGATQDWSRGCSHCFMMALDSPESLRLVLQSKTFAKLVASFEPLQLRHQVVAAFPLQVTATVDAPRSTRAKSSNVRPRR